MRILDLQPGFYKIRIRDLTPPPAANARSMKTLKDTSLLRVEGVGEQKMYFIDDLPEGFHPHDVREYMETYEVVAKLNGPPEVLNPNITISFRDQQGSQYAWSVKGAWALRALFERMPWLQKPFGYFRNRSKIHK